MSRTDKTKPLRVRRAEHDPWPVHDHRDGVCDLPDSPMDDKRAGCRWSDDCLLLVHSCCSHCGNRSCGKEWQWYRRVENRKDRYASRREVRRYADDE
ncbi:hypothetical protein ACQPYK_15380 [Streptosporangium sp. CA-135522]|uniref:hypothetical protein n=1 Tax=Streptosporangium sp. CA-135522 TaxID=3240072 RepID=UPI003D8E1159